MKYSIIIPAYNEEARIAATVEDYAKYIQSSMDPQETELWIVVNGSSDRTGEIALGLERKYPFVHAWVTEQRRGKGGAVMKGFELAQGEILAFTDADNATIASELRKLIIHTPEPMRQSAPAGCRKVVRCTPALDTQIASRYSI